MTSGVRPGTSGKPPLPAWALAYAIIAVATVAFMMVNTFSVLDEHSWAGRPIEWWKPAVWEATSGIVLLGLAWAPMQAIRRFPLSRGLRLRNLALHGAFSILFSVAHVGLMVALRIAAYATAGESYRFGDPIDGLLYEYRKDLMSYTLYAGIYWLALRLVGEGPAASTAEPEAPSILIDEGQRVHRVAPAEILAARSCGNYVEFLLADGRRPLMRTTLAGLGTQLAGLGFVRTHRSWLVNPRRVVRIEAEGSGDHGLTLDDGTAVPLSRRYREALEALRGGA